MSVTVSDSEFSELDQYPTMLWLLTASGVLNEIRERPVTILSPSERAFREFVHVDFYDLMSNPAAMAPILRRHVVLGEYDAESFAMTDSVTTLAGDQLTVWSNGRMLMVDEVTLTLTRPTPSAHAASDLADTATSGEVTMIVYSIDRLLLDRVGTP